MPCPRDDHSRSRGKLPQDVNSAQQGKKAQWEPQPLSSHLSCHGVTKAKVPSITFTFLAVLPDKKKTANKS
jgi:hypothetical protein